MQLSYYRGLHFHADRRVVSNPKGINQHSEVECQNDIQPQTLATARKLAEKYNVSPSTIARDSRLADALLAIGEVSLEAKQSILSGETRLTRKELDAVLSGSMGFDVIVVLSIRSVKKYKQTLLFYLMKDIISGQVGDINGNGEGGEDDQKFRENNNSLSWLH